MPSIQFDDTVLSIRACSTGLSTFGETEGYRDLACLCLGNIGQIPGDRSRDGLKTCRKQGKGLHKRISIVLIIGMPWIQYFVICDQKTAYHP
jgi:hypothetical protein